jgi:hypothetical protein
MTFKQMARTLNRNANRYASDGNVAKAIACLELAALIVQRGYTDIQGHVTLSDQFNS